MKCMAWGEGKESIVDYSMSSLVMGFPKKYSIQVYVAMSVQT